MPGLDDFPSEFFCLRSNRGKLRQPGQLRQLRQPGQPGQPRQPRQPRHPRQPRQPRRPGRPGQPGQLRRPGQRPILTCYVRILT
eukprot:6941021-Prymnesium_polylepis.1